VKTKPYGIVFVIDIETVKYIHMKKVLLCAASIAVVMSSQAQETNVVNRGFETWNDKVYTHITGLTDALEERLKWDAPDSLVVEKSTDAKEGSYSLILSNKESGTGNDKDTSAGYFIVGGWGDSGPEGGVPFTLAADTMRGWYKYNVMPGDTAWMILNLKMGGSTIAGGQYPIVGTQSTWKQFAFATNYNAGVVDTLFLAVTSSNIVGDDDGEGIPGSWLQIDDMSFTTNSGGSATFTNAGFESWTDTTISTIDYWNTVDLTLNKSTSVNSGSYAAELEVKEITHGDGQKERVGAIIANYDFDGNNKEGGTDFTAMPSKLEWYWDATPAANDTGWVSIEFFKNGLSIGSFGKQSYIVTSGYQPESMLITLAQNPDTFKIAVYAGDSIGSKMIIDDINLVSDASVSVSESSGGAGAAFPNPTNGFVNVGSASNYAISNVIGVQVQAGSVSNGSVSFSDLADGVYVLSLYDDSGGLVSNEKVVKE
jgi:hypothetical protein